MRYIYEQILKDDGITLRGVVNTPDDFEESGKYPVVIFYHGFSGDRNGPVWFTTQHSQYLTDKGYITVRFDFSGTNESDGSFYDMTVSREVEEGILIYNFTKTLEFVDKDRIYLIGHSLGGVVTTLLAHKKSPRAIALLAPASDMNNPENIKRVATIEEMDIGGIKINTNFMKDMADIDIYGSAKKYDGNVLIIRGTEDKSVSDEANQKLKESYQHASYEQIEEADHEFKNFNHRSAIFDLTYEFFENNK